MFLRLWAALCAALLVTSALWAQSERGTITGTVRDASGAVVPGAKVTLTNTQTGVAFTIPSTNANGDYTVPQLPVGIYTVRVEKEGFRPASIIGHRSERLDDVRADANLEVGATTTAVEVSASALAHLDGKLQDQRHHQQQAGGRTSAGGRRHAAQPVRSGLPHAGSQELGGDNGFMLGGGQAAATAPTWTGSRPTPRARFARAGSPSTRRRSKRSPSSRWTPTASRPSSAMPAAA